MTIPMASPRDMTKVIQSKSWAATHFSGIDGSITSTMLDIVTRSKYKLHKSSAAPRKMVLCDVMWNDTRLTQHRFRVHDLTFCIHYHKVFKHMTNFSEVRSSHSHFPYTKLKHISSSYYIKSFQNSSSERKFFQMLSYRSIWTWQILNRACKR